MPAPSHLIFHVELWACCILAWTSGGRTGRIGAVINLVAVYASVILLRSPSARWTSPETGILLIDLAVFASFLALALRSGAYWPIWAAGFALAEVAVHLARLASPSLPRMVYASTVVPWADLALLAMAIGTGWRRVARPARSLRSSPTSAGSTPRRSPPRI